MTEKAVPHNEFFAKLNDRASKTCLSVGLDPVYYHIPQSLKERYEIKNLPQTQERVASKFLVDIIDATADFACIFKPNRAFFSDEATEKTLVDMVAYIHEKYKDIPVLLDGKYGDVSLTTSLYEYFAFDKVRADAVTVNPYAGRKSLQPFLDRPDKAVFAWVRSSELGSNEFQDIEVSNNDMSRSEFGRTIPMYQHMAKTISSEWTRYENVGLVVGGTNPDAVRRTRRVIADDIWILGPGAGSQGADINLTIPVGVNREGNGLLISASSSIMYASDEADYAQAAGREAERLYREINKIRFAAVESKR